MKFWQRAYLSILVLFIVCFYVSIFMVSNFAYRSSLNNERDRSSGEAGFISASLKNDFDIAIITQKGGGGSLEENAFFSRYLSYYANRDIYLALWKNDTYLFGNLPISLTSKYEPASEEQISLIMESSQKKYSLVASSFMCGSNSYTLIYMHDLYGFTDEHNSLSTFLIMSGAALTAILAAGLYFLLRRLSKPIENLDEATGRISKGDYSIRVPIKGKDEFAALALKFNGMADEIEAKINELQASAENKQRFIDNLAHELRNPLTAIRGYAEYLKNANIDEDDRIESVDRIVSDTARIEEMAIKLLDLALLRNNALVTANIDIKDLLDAVTDRLRSMLAEKKILLEKNYEQSGIVGDRVLLESLIFNLLDNAIKASNEGATIKLSGFMDNGVYTIGIQDFGKGMSTEHLDKLTEPFYRVDKARSRSEGGAGLGLALCEQIAELHRAKMVFHSEIGKGTTVTVSFATP